MDIDRIIEIGLRIKDLRSSLAAAEEELVEVITNSAIQQDPLVEQVTNVIKEENDSSKTISDRVAASSADKKGKKSKKKPATRAEKIYEVLRETPGTEFSTHQLRDLVGGAFNAVKSDLFHMKTQGHVKLRNGGRTKNWFVAP